MKNILLVISLVFSSASLFSQSAPLYWCDDFESYNVGDPIAQTSPDWNSWAELMNGLSAPFTDDAFISSNYASSGNNCLGFNANSSVAGPEDVVLPIGAGTPYVSGVFTLTHMIYVVSGAYWNIQAENTPGITWALDVTLDATGNVNYATSGSAQTLLAATYPVNTWFEQSLVCDLTTNSWEVFHDGVSQGSFSNPVNQVASIDYYPTAGQEFYIDDVCLPYVPAQLDSLNAQVLSIDAINGLATQDRFPTVNVRNFGIDNINSFDVTFDYNGSQITENITGLTLTTNSITNITFTNSITLGGISTAQAYISNINGGMMQSTADDTLATNLNISIPATGKLVIGEEATGTWCGWCPRGSVALNWMDKDYEGFWQGIAVHNGDPMTDATYDNAIGNYIAGYPSGLVDRGPAIDPGAFSQDFIQRVVIPPHAMITNGAKIENNVLKVSLDLDFQMPISGNWRLACAVVEDSVTGTGPQYFQANSYSGGNSGSLIDVDGTDWANLGSNVNSNMMIYRHVARAISPSFLGDALPQNSYSIGDQETVCFEFPLDPSWDLDQVHIVGMLFDSQGSTDNGSSSTIGSAETNGYQNCSNSTEAIFLNGPDDLSIYPNPSNNVLYVNNLPAGTKNISIVNIQGKVVIESLAKDIIDVSKLSAGIYQINFKGLDWVETRKIVIK
jgi:hypothetical protein